MKMLIVSLCIATCPTLVSASSIVSQDMISFGEDGSLTKMLEIDPARLRGVKGSCTVK